MAAKRVRAGLTGLGDEKKCCGWAPIASASENESMRDWSLPEGPVSAKSLLGLASILGQCSGSAALSSRQASSPSSPSHCRTAAVLKSAFVPLVQGRRVLLRSQNLPLSRIDAKPSSDLAHTGPSTSRQGVTDSFFQGAVSDATRGVFSHLRLA
jgi:hypothetical protein